MNVVTTTFFNNPYYSLSTMLRKSIILVATLICIAIVAVPTGAIGSGSVDGVTVQVGPDTENEILNDVETYADEWPVALGTEVSVLYSEGERWYVISDEPVATGETTVEGLKVSEDDLFTPDFNVIVADSVDTETSGTPVSLGELRENPHEYDESLVQVTGDYQQISHVFEVADGGLSQQATLGVFDAESNLTMAPPGQVGQWAAMNLSSPDVGDGRDAELERRLGDSPIVVQNTGSQQFWVDSETTIDAVVLVVDGTPTLHIADQTVPGTAVDGIDTIASGDHDGEVVTIEADAAELQISTKETLLAAAECGTDAVYIGNSCLPILGDTVVHAGVLYEEEPTSREDTLLFTALSNQLQDVPAETRHSQLRVTGEVVSASDLDPAFEDQRALLIYEIEEVGEPSADLPGLADEYQKELEGYVEERMQMAQEDDPNPIANYANENGVVETDGLRDGISNWRSGDIETTLLRDVISAWRTGESVV